MPGEPTIVRFQEELTAPDMVRLRDEYGLKLDQYIPELSYLERLQPETIARLRDDFLVRETRPLSPAQKLGPSIELDGPPEFSATLLDDADADTVVSLLATLGARDVRLLDDRDIGGRARILFVLDDTGRLGRVADVPDVVWIDRVGVIRANSVPDAATIQSGRAAKSSIWDRGLHGEGQVIGLIDLGPIDINHCFFAGPFPNSPGPTHRKLLQVRDALLPNGDPKPAEDHATFVAGIAAGDELGDAGNHPHRAGAWAARLVCGNVDGLVANGMLRELKTAAMAGAVVHNNSWNLDKSPYGAYTNLASDVDSFTWDNEDHLVLGGSGNSFEQVGSQLIPGNLSPPGIAKNAICVSAAKADPDQLTRGEGVFGPTRDGRHKPDLVAVGCGTHSALKNTPCETRPLPCATSMATPNAAAATALVRQYFVEGWYPTGEKRARDAMTPTGALLKAILLNSTVRMAATDSKPDYPSAFEGWGLITLDRTLHFRGAARSLVVWDVRHAAGLSARETRRHTLKVGARTEQLKITLVWTDFPASPGAFAKPAVNNLDLKATAPERTQYLGNDMKNGVSVPGGTRRDAVNNVEMVIVDNPPLGRWTIEVHAANVLTFGRQGYALVASGGSLAPLLKARP